MRANVCANLLPKLRVTLVVGLSNVKKRELSGRDKAVRE